ncbi:hypothetical protein ACMYUJ_12090 [Stutzerimonas zhaodongensis]|uniref:hypothetical protein n=1 Tax=Stutzerimonas zhaodongensis TaxID=1176257 RepID=UPI0039EEAC64
MDLIKEVLDEVVDQYRANNHIIFSSDSERASLHFGDVAKRLKAWKKGRECIVPKCSQTAIKQSHTVPRGMSLSSISEAEHLLTPEFDHRLGKLVLQRVGQNKASTFPGFCSEHEALFHEFETSGKIDQSQHIYLQTYRAACREWFRTSFILEQHDRTMAEYDRLRDERLAALVKRRLRERGFGGEFKMGKLELKNDTLKNQWSDELGAIRKYDIWLKTTMLPAFEKAIFQGDTSNVYTYAISIDVQIPVALSGGGAFHVRDTKAERRVDMIIGVMPSDGNTLLTFGGHASDEDFINAYVTTWMNNAFGMLSMVESWMVNGSDQWYLKPSVWNALPEGRRSAILSAIHACEQNIGQEFETSIFDELRNNFLVDLAAQEEKKDEKYSEFVDKQRRKMI